MSRSYYDDGGVHAGVRIIFIRFMNFIGRSYFPVKVGFGKILVLVDFEKIFWCEFCAVHADPNRRSVQFLQPMPPFFDQFAQKAIPGKKN